MTSDEKLAHEVITYLMHKHFPGWDKRGREFETFAEYTDWVERCLDSIIIYQDTRRDQ